MADASDPGQLLLAERLRERARSTPQRTACTFLRENGAAQEICYAELAARVDALAAHMLDLAAPGQRALLLYPAGIDFIVAFCACLAAGIHAVPAAPAHRARDAARLEALLADAAPALVLCTLDAHAACAAALARAACTAPLLAGLAGACAAAPAYLPRPESGSVAFLQYTSGSTGRPRGVEVTHANIAANVAAIGSAFGFGPETVMVSWLPPFHDMGLIGSIVAPLMLGFHTVLMAPGSFLRRPAAWLEAVTRYRATCSGGPNFAWDLCLRRIPDAQKAQLELSSLEVLYNGAEPVRAATLEAFMAAFGPCGLRREALFPCYGMAEATLLVAGGPRGRAPRLLALDTAALERGAVSPAAPGQAGSRLLVGCGGAAPGVALAVVDPVRGIPMPDDEIGELWIAGPGVARGYHARGQDSARSFGLRIAQAPARLNGARWLRSGDLGFMRDGEVYITGRCKDVIVVHGRKIHAQDVEALAESAGAELAPNSCAAFALDGEDEVGGERLALVVEATRALARGGDLDALACAIRARVTAGTGVALQLLAFVAPGVFPRTTSGKVQRARCKELLQRGALPLLAVRSAAHEGSAARADAAIAWLRGYAARRLDSRLADERRSLAPHVLLDFGARGLLGLQAPRTQGGLALATKDLVRVMAQLAAIDLTLATLVGVHNGLGLRPLLRFAPAALRAEWLPVLAGGRQLAAFALSEPQAGSNPRSIGSRAEQVDGGWRLDGEKHLIGLAGWAGVLTVFARAFDATGRALGTIALLVPADAPGLSFGAEAPTMGMRAMPQGALRFDSVFVPGAQVLGEPGAGMEVAQDAMGFARLGIGALCVGAMQRCLQLMARYAERRDIAGGRLLDNPVTLLRLHELDCAIEAGKALVDALAGDIDTGATLPQDACSACKCVLSELLWEAADRLVQMLGGRGYLENNLAPQLLRDARVLRILEGPSEALYAHLGAVARLPANALMAAAARIGMPGQPAWPARLPAQGGGAWQDVRNGEFAAWTLLAAGARGEAAEWARRRLALLRHAIEAESGALAPGPTAGALLARVARHARAIGDVEQDAPGEAQGLDPLLRQAAPETAVAPVAAPAAPSSLELVRDCVARWLREGGLGEGLPGIAVDVAAEGESGSGAAPRREDWSVDTPFSDLGIDSLASVPLALEIEQAGGVPVSAELLYDYPTVRALAAYIDEQRHARPREPGGERQVQAA